jgi:lipopolysaccharide assembly outer membrane protein LptD (OstA)
VVEEQKAMIRPAYIFLAVTLASVTLVAQQRLQTAGDTLRVPPRIRAESAGTSADTLRPVESPSGVDTVVTYTAADSIHYALKTRNMYLYGKGDIKYREMGLKAEAIDINWNTSILNARGVVDASDSTGKRMKGEPVLIDGNETYNGSTVAYNFKTKKGKIDIGKTEIDQGLYYGDEIKKVDTDVLYVSSGRFTTCNLEHPHYYFGSPEMKVIVRDKVIARPILFYIADVPVFALPFGIFPSERGRRSGIIMPAYGESSRGRYLTHLGYYWAMNDYMDWSIRTDLYSKGSYTLSSDFRYALRYAFSGDISASYGRVLSGEPGDPAYGDDKVFNVHLGHSQDFNPTTRLMVDFTFMSSSYLQQTSYNLNDLLRQNVISNATLTKYWEGTPNSMSINVRRDQNLQPDSGAVEVTEVLPSITFSRTLSYPFRSSARAASTSPQHWYEYIGYSYNGQFLNNRTKTKLEPGSRLDQRAGVQHNITVNASPKLGYFSISPFFNYTEKWYNESIERGLFGGDTIPTTRDIYGLKAVRYFDMGVSASTKLYGIFQPGILGITGIRHQLVPSISYTFQPDFSKGHFGYYAMYVDQYGQVQSYSRFEREVFGGAPSGERQAISLSVGNVFEMKTASSDSTVKENKFQLLNVNLGVGYNFAADSMKFSEVGVDYRTSIGQLLSIGGSGRFNLYQFAVDPNNPLIGRRVNKFLLKEEGKLAELTSFSISIGTRLSGERKKTEAGPVKTAADTLRQRGQRTGVYGLYDQEEPDFSIPWNLDLMWNFSQNQSDPRYKYRSSSLIIGLGFNLTELWKINASASYDVLNREVAAPQISVYRDLHCWEMNFSWVPLGQWRNFRLEIRLKAPQLQDIKVTKQASAQGIY